MGAFERLNTERSANRPLLRDIETRGDRESSRTSGRAPVRRLEDGVGSTGGGAPTALITPPVTEGAGGALAKPTITSPAPAAAAAFPVLPTELGVLRDMVKTKTSLTGSGFHVVAVPDPSSRIPNGFPGVFGLVVAEGKETLNLNPVGPIVNRSMSGESSSAGLEYEQVVVDATSGRGLHKEKGQYLNTDGKENGDALRRQFQILRGAQVDAIGSSKVIEGAPQIPAADATPFTINGSGERVNDDNASYLKPYTTATLPEGTPAGSTLNPSLVLQKALDKFKADGVTITSTREFNYAATHPEGLGGKKPEGGIQNSDALAGSAKVVKFKSTEWAMTGKKADGTDFNAVLKLQEHHVVFAGIHWPHIHTSILQPTS